MDHFLLPLAGLFFYEIKVCFCIIWFQKSYLNVLLSNVYICFSLFYADFLIA